MKNYWLQSGFYTFLQRFSTLVFGFGGFYILIRMQSKHDFGIWALVISITALLEVARNGLIQNGLIKYSIGANEKEQKEIQSASLFLNITLTIVSCIFLLTAGPYFETLWHANGIASLLRVYCLTSIAFIPFQQFSYLQQSNFDFKSLSIMYMVRQGSFFGVILFNFVFVHHISLNTLIWSTFYTSVISSIVGYIMVRKYFYVAVLPSKYWIVKLFNYGKYSFGTNVSGMLFNSIDQFMLGSMAGTAQVAIYNASSKINNLVEVPISTVASIVFPQTSLKANENNTESVKLMYEKSVSVLLAMILPVIIFVALIPTITLTFIAGSSYAEYPGVLMIILLFSLLQPFSRQFGTVLDSLGKPNINFYCISGAAIINLVLNYSLIPVWGIYGAAFSTFMALLISVIVNLVILKQLINVNFISIISGIVTVYKFIYSKVLDYLKPIFVKQIVL